MYSEHVVRHNVSEKSGSQVRKVGGEGNVDEKVEEKMENSKKKNKT
jgi:hypothetical protein